MATFFITRTDPTILRMLYYFSHLCATTEPLIETHEDGWRITVSAAGSNTSLAPLVPLPCPVRIPSSNNSFANMRRQSKCRSYSAEGQRALLSMLNSDQNISLSLIDENGFLLLNAFCADRTSIVPLIIFRGENLSSIWIPANTHESLRFSYTTQGWISNIHGLK
jgi:hypothetical protein